MLTPVYSTSAAHQHSSHHHVTNRHSATCANKQGLHERSRSRSRSRCTANAGVQCAAAAYLFRYSVMTFCPSESCMAVGLSGQKAQNADSSGRLLSTS